MSDPATVMAYLASKARPILGSSRVKASKPLFGGTASLDLYPGDLHYKFRSEGHGVVVQRESVAGGFSVGMKDTLAASRWPDQLVIDLANHADANGQDWRRALESL
ncbi:MAG: hypothetical protein ABR573_11145 [Candidatus Dormibacteria bacterium]